MVGRSVRLWMRHASTVISHVPAQSGPAANCPVDAAAAAGRMTAVFSHDPRMSCYSPAHPPLLLLLLLSVVVVSPFAASTKGKERQTTDRNKEKERKEEEEEEGDDDDHHHHHHQFPSRLNMLNKKREELR